MGTGSELEAAVGITSVDYIDKEGIKRRVLLPVGEEDGAIDEGIPVSLPVDTLYLHMPLTFRKELIEALWNVGLIEPEDFLRGDAPNRIRAALMSVIKHDTMDILNLAREMKNGK